MTYLSSTDIEGYVSRVKELRAQQVALAAPEGLFEELYQEVSQGIEELRIADEELRLRDAEIYTAYAAVVRERRRYRDLFDHAPEAMILTDYRGVLTDANLSAARLFELSAEHLRGKPLGAFVERSQRATFRRWFSDVLLDPNMPSRMQIVLNAPHRGRFRAEAHVTRVEGEVPSALQLLWTIGDLTQGERARRDAELAAIVRASGDAIITQSLEGRVQTINPACLGLFGPAFAQAVGQPMERWIAPECREHHAQVIDGLTPAAPVRSVDSIHLRTDGVKINVSVTYSLIATPDEAQGVALVVREITDRKRLESKLREEALEHERSSHRKTDFISVLAHELRNPLNVITTAADSPLTRDDLAEICLRNARYMARLVNELLDMSRISRNELTVVPARVPLHKIVSRAVELAHPVLEARGQKLHVELADERIQIVVDPVRIAQALSNLLDNAAKYSTPGESIRLRVELGAKQVSFQVTDSGIGIDGELITRVFEPFVQGEHARRGSRSGLGLGLALVKRIVDLHGGSVAAESAGPGCGARFTMVLPVGDSTPSAT